MTSVFPQFGALDYSGLTTEEEMMRQHTFVNGERGSPLIGARISADQRAQIPAGLPYSYMCRDPQPVAPAIAPTIAPTVAPQPTTMTKKGAQQSTITEAVLQLFNSQPVSAMDWIILIIIFIAILCFIEYAGEILAPLLHQKPRAAAST